MLSIKVLGSGCENCKKVENIARQAAATMGLQADFIKVTDWQRSRNTRSCLRRAWS